MTVHVVQPRFEVALAHVLKWEGGYVDDPDDPGGATKWGIALNRIGRALGLRHRHEIAGLTRAEAARIYRAHYWTPCRCGELPAGLALAVFDGAVNQGPGRAVRLLQKAAHVRADGVIGPVTLAAARRPGVLKELMVRRALHYTSLVKFAKYGLGWLRRLFDTFEAALALDGGAVETAPGLRPPSPQPPPETQGAPACERARDRRSS